MTARRTVLAALALPLMGCLGGVPLIEVAEIRFDPPEVDLPARAAQVRRAAAGLGWTAAEAAPGRIRATSDGEGGPAAVEIAFDRRAFSIRHGAGAGAAPTPTPAYNLRVAALRDAIVAQSGF